MHKGHPFREFQSLDIEIPMLPNYGETSQNPISIFAVNDKTVILSPAQIISIVSNAASTSHKCLHYCTVPLDYNLAIIVVSIHVHLLEELVLYCRKTL